MRQKDGVRRSYGSVEGGLSDNTGCVAGLGVSHMVYSFGDVPTAGKVLLVIISIECADGGCWRNIRLAEMLDVCAAAGGGG